MQLEVASTVTWPGIAERCHVASRRALPLPASSQKAVNRGAESPHLYQGLSGSLAPFKGFLSTLSEPDLVHKTSCLGSLV